jgi:AI-2 transport protein TqsA
MNSRTSLHRAQTVCLAIIATVLVTYMIFWLRPVLVPFVVAVFVVSGVAPLLDALEYRLSVSRPIAAAIAFVFGLLALAFLGFFLWLSILEMADKGPAYRTRINSLVASAEKYMDKDWLNLRPPEFVNPGPEPVEIAENSREREVDQYREPDDFQPLDFLGKRDRRDSERLDADGLDAEELDAEGLGAEGLDGGQPGSQGYSGGGGPSDSLRIVIDQVVRDGLATLSRELFRLATTSVVVLIYVFFLLLGSPTTRNEQSAFHRINHQVRSYLSLKTVISIFTGGFVGVTLWFFNVPMALTFGMLAFLLNYIPNIGPIVASLLPIPFIVLHPGATWWWVIATIGTVSAIQTISGNLVEPKLMGDSSGLHPVTILLSLMFWGMMWGITGMFLAIPITAGIKIVLEGIPSTRPIAEVMAGRWEAAAELSIDQ